MDISPRCTIKPLNLEKELSDLASHLKITFSPASDFKQNIIVTDECKKQLMACGWHVTGEYVKQAFPKRAPDAPYAANKPPSQPSITAELPSPSLSSRNP